MQYVHFFHILKIYLNFLKQELLNLYSPRIHMLFVLLYKTVGFLSLQWEIGYWILLTRYGEWAISEVLGSKNLDNKSFTWDAYSNLFGSWVLESTNWNRVQVLSEVTQSCLTLCDPIDCSLAGSSVRGIFQARVLEWGAIAFSCNTPYRL